MCKQNRPPISFDDVIPRSVPQHPSVTATLHIITLTATRITITTTTTTTTTATTTTTITVGACVASAGVIGGTGVPLHVVVVVGGGGGGGVYTAHIAHAVAHIAHVGVHGAHVGVHGVHEVEGILVDPSPSTLCPPPMQEEHAPLLLPG